MIHLSHAEGMLRYDILSARFVPRGCYLLSLFRVKSCKILIWSFYAIVILVVKSLRVAQSFLPSETNLSGKIRLGEINLKLIVPFRSNSPGPLFREELLKADW